MEEKEFDFYQTYNAERYIHFRFIPTGEYEIVESKRNGKMVPLRKPLLEKQKLSFEEVKQLNLDNYGQDVRTASDDFTLVHNYLLDFWSAIMGADAVMVYIHLKRYCYSGKDFCFPDMETIRKKMKMGSKATLNKYMEILEQHGFIAKIHRIDTQRNNGFASPFFKVRRYIPLLSKDLIEELPKDLQKEHEKFLAKANNINLDDTFDPEVFIKDLMNSAEVMKSSHQKSKEEQLKYRGKLKEYILLQLTADEREKWSMILQELSKKVSKPSFDTWFKDTIIRVDEVQSRVTLYAANSFVLDWIRNSYRQIIIDIIQDLLTLQIREFYCLQYEDFEQGD